mgnify:CR=1 FL=1
MLRRLVIAVLVLAASALPSAAQTSDDLFNPEQLQRIELWLNAADWEKLKANFQENTYYPADLVWNGITVQNVGIRSRGFGSRRGSKPGLRVDMNRYADGQTFLGLKAFVLDNLSQDPSGIRESVTFKFYTMLGIPTARKSHAQLFINGRFAGLYGVVEAVDKTMLARLFGSINGNVQNDGYLFEYNYLTDSPWRFTYEGSDLAPYKKRFEIKTNDTKSDAQIWGPIEQLVRLVNDTDSSRFESVVGPLIDLHQFTRYMALQNFVAENDGFNGYAAMNNFYIYRLEQSDKHVFIPKDEGVAFLQPDFGITLRLDENVLTRKTLALNSYSSEYFSVLLEAADLANGWLRQEIQREFDLTTESMLADPAHLFSAEEYQADKNNLLAFADARVTYVRCEVAKVLGSTRPAGCQ